MALPVRTLAFLLIGAVLVLGLESACRGVLWRRELNPILRGRLLTERLGCVNCHRPVGAIEIPNPASRWGTVPRFQGGNAFMYGPSRAEIEEFIRFGAPRAWLDEPRVEARLAGQRLRMPAFGDRLSDTEVGSLVSYVAALEGVEPRGGEDAAAGRELARQEGCLSCHGIEGSGGLPNPGSLGGFVPGFLGGNFTDLVANRGEFDEWVRTGTSTRLASNPLIRYFWQRQEISMPAYRETLDEQQIGALWDWVQALRAAS